jgi:hypothetical protein
MGVIIDWIFNSLSCDVEVLIAIRAAPLGLSLFSRWQIASYCQHRRRLPSAVSIYALSWTGKVLLSFFHTSILVSQL